MTPADDPPAEVLERGSFTVSLKTWDTEFFGRRIGSLEHVAPVAHGDAQTPHSDLAQLCLLADDADYDLLECHVPTDEFNTVSTLEDCGFRLVDSRIQFRTRWSIEDDQPMEPRVGTIRAAVPSDRDRIIALTHEGLTDNPRFVSRFKDPAYYSSDETRRYFEAWIEWTAFDEDAATAVYEVDGEVVGYYIYHLRGEHEGLPVVKGILTAVSPEHRGANAQLAMQSFLYRRLEQSEWVLDNTTQLTNTAVIRNHIRSDKRLEQIVLTFYRRRPA